MTQLCDAGVDFIKDDEISADPAACAAGRARAGRDGGGARPCAAHRQAGDGGLQHHRRDRRHEPPCRPGRARGRHLRDGAASTGAAISGIETLRRHTPLALHGHRNGYGALSRHPLLGISFQAYQALWRLAGVDHMHVHGLQGKFSQPDEEVIESARDCVAPLAASEDAWTTA